ncbi:MAG: rRNA maturation RNase YbeY [Oscillospiraceae bacterium]|nr:rRNA maturation RNase YbeY [Oscillospiraceae bacterium]
MKHEISLSREKRGLGHPEAAALVKRAVRDTLDAEGVSQPCLVGVVLTDDEGIRRVNSEFRGIDRATDVLSFPFNELQPGAFDPAECERDPESGRLLLGDMMISLERCAAQGEEFGHGFEREIRYLAVHSALHLLGYDHVDEGKMKKRMRAREKEIMGDGEA